MLSKHEFMADSDLKREAVEVEGLGVVLMRELTVWEKAEALRIHADLLDGLEGDLHDVVQSLILLAITLCEENGLPMFSEDEIGAAVQNLKGRSQRTISALQLAFLRLNGLGDDEIEAAVGNSREILSESYSSGSHGISDTPTSAALRSA